MKTLSSAFEQVVKGFLFGSLIACGIFYLFDLDKYYEVEPITELPIVYELTDTYQQGLTVFLPHLENKKTNQPLSDQQIAAFQWNQRRILEELEHKNFSKEQLRSAKKYVNYIAENGESAMQDMRESGVFASIKLAQALLESAAGTSKLARATNNHFGIKARTNESGRRKIRNQQHSALTNYDFSPIAPAVDVFRMKDDHYHDRFEIYLSIGDSYARHSQLLTRDCTVGKVGCYGWIWSSFPVSMQDYSIEEAANKFYSFSKISPTQFFDGRVELPYYAAAAAGLKMAGYATSKTYHKKIAYLIDTYQLWRFDLTVSHLR